MVTIDLSFAKIKEFIVKYKWQIIGVRVALLAYALSKMYQRRKHRGRLMQAIKNTNEKRSKGIQKIRDRLEARSDIDKHRDEEILKLLFNDLKAALQNGTVSAVEVLRAYQGKALEAHEATNCVTKFVSEAEEWARDLDAMVPSMRPPLFGIPFSVKESIQMKGYDSTRGYAAELGKPCNQDANSVAILRELGAIPFVRTNVPQSLLSFGCFNSIYGITGNPYNKDRIPGGSSGGEGALVGSHGAPFGLGTDVGGSIRLPAHFCGIAGIKPTSTRVTQKGSSIAVPGRAVVMASFGPMAPEVDAIVTIMRHLTNGNSYERDPYAAPIPFREEIFSSNRPLTIGYYDFDGFFEAVPAMKRAVKLVKTQLESAGHILRPWNPPDSGLAMKLFLGTVTMDSGEYLKEKLTNDIVHPLMKDAVTMLTRPPKLKRAISKVVAPFSPRVG